jgi:acetyl-CoA decarbonylase/synthase complex subunit gamma
MALTAMAIYKNLPKTNCGDCKFPTCMAFAMQVAAKQKALADCPHLSEQAKEAFSEASAPPMRLVHLGPVEGGFEIGQETAMFRHEGKFHKKTGLAVKIPAALPENEALAKLDRINQSKYVRVGQEISVALAAVEIEGLPAEQAAARVKALAEKSRVPLVVMGRAAAAMHAAVGAIAAKRPLIYQASPENAAAFIGIALEQKCPLAVGAPTLERMAEITSLAREKGVADLILAFDGTKLAQTICDLTSARRAALKKNVRAFGFPAMVDVCQASLFAEAALASTFVAKYAGIIIINGIDGAELLPLLTMIQNIYTDPQVPNEVESKLYSIGKVDDHSPVLFTTNFALTYFSVAGEVERSKVPAYICVVETGGLGVLNAYAGDKLSPEKVVQTLAQQQVAEKVKHRRLIIPGLLPAFKAEIEETSVWKEVIIGPQNASGIPAFLPKHCQ